MPALVNVVNGDDISVASLVNLPSVLKTRIASFLNHQDFIRFSRTKKVFRSEIWLSSLSPPYELIYSQVWLGTTGDDVPKKAERIPVFSSQPHSITLTCKWKDQGWGEHLGRLYVVAERSENTQQHQQKHQECSSSDSDKEHFLMFHGRRVVCESSPSPHEYSSLELTFSPRRDEIYHLWYKVGGVGGSYLMVDNLVVHSLVYDDQERSLRTIYSKVCQLRILESNDEDDEEDSDYLFGEKNEDLIFYTGLLINVVETLIRTIISKGEIDPLPSFVISFFELHSLKIDLTNLLSIQAICHFFLQYLDFQTLPFCTDNELQDRVGQSAIVMESPFLVVNQQQLKNPTDAELQPFTLIPYVTWENDSSSDDVLIQCTRIPILDKFTKSVRMTCHWKDGGFLNSTGRLVVVAKKIEDGEIRLDKQMKSLQDGVRVVCMSPTIPVTMGDLEMSFVPQTDEVYFLYRKTRCGSLMFVEDLNIHLTIQNDKAGALAQNFKNMIHCGALNRKDEDRSFYFHLLVAVTGDLLNNASKGAWVKGAAEAVFLESNGFPIHSRTLRPLQEMVKCLIELHEQREMKESNQTTSNDNAEMIFRNHAAM